MRILVVEDDFASRRMMQRLLASYGPVDVVVDGGEAVEAFKMGWDEERPYELVFMDIMMPRMNGQEALKRIRTLEKSMGVKSVDEVKIIMTTVMEDPKNVVEAFSEGGATAYLVKPIELSELRAELEKLGFHANA
ncbi:MAG: two-component system response regulator [Treponema sp. GWB1_62_6]|nr:MAG: two-component system response regulator [Treponema sp. GWA1_62_8]OHE69313.1 MAG: two-component system response regulator [Treponema sp. GWC1_61_84]OHE70752.1 MAG: two-component system response regulator [Treponema sp. GWB1_62_6]OHE76735.1 MAG: two-component system response regulator [Treponema sp. RIFOXYC1_FULL_61_9]HCM26274.1 response regulator [Treponema sp.]